MPYEEPLPPTEPTWSWDASLYAGSAAHYPVGRVAYRGEVAEALVTALDLDGTGVLIDVGCGPGSLTLLMASSVAEAFGVDPDGDMLQEGARLAASQQIRNVSWRLLRGEDLPADLPAPRVVTFAQSFHWMDRPRVAAAVRIMLTGEGACVHVGGTTHQGIASAEKLPHPQPPRDEIAQLIRRYLGPDRRAGQGVLTGGTADGEGEVFRQAGFDGPQRLVVPGRLTVRTVEQVAASVYSLSSSAPHLFADRLAAFDGELRRLLIATSDQGHFSEQMSPITLSIWR